MNVKLRQGKRKITKVAIVLVVAFIIFNIAWFLNPLGYIIRDVGKGKQRQIRLLCETDFQVLLEACRQLSSRVATGDLKPQQYNVRIKPHSEISRFPQPILDLEPTYVIIDIRGSVTIELHGGFLHYGVMAYPEDFEKPPGAEYGDMKLIDGLWYYDEDYKRSPKIQKKIEELLQKRHR